MKQSVIIIVLIFQVIAGKSQEMEQYPISRMDSAIIISNLEKYERELKKQDWKEASRYLNANGLIYWEHNFLTEAVDYYERSILLNTKINNASGIAMIYNNLGMIQADLRNHKVALDYFEKTLAARKYQKKKRGMIAALHNIAIELNNLQRHNEAITRLDEALVYARELNDPEQLRLCYGMLAETYEKNGDTENSFKYFNLYRTFHEMIQKQQIEASEKKVKEAENQLKIVELEQRNQFLELQLRKKTITEQERIIEEKDSTNVLLVQKMTNQQKNIKILEQNAALMRQETELLKKDSEIKKLQEKQLANQAQLLKRRSIILLITMIGLISLAFATYFFFAGRKRERRANALLIKLNEDIKEQKDEILAQTIQLQDKNRELYKLNRFKDGMTGMMVHDMKNPLNVVFHHVKDIPNAKPRYAVQNAGRQMMNMIQNLLDVQKFENSVMPLNIETHALKSILQESVENVEFLASKKNINIVFRSEYAYSVRADKDALLRVTVNLLTNAIKYSPLNDKIIIEIEENEKYLTISVKDNGPGISAENKTKVFEMFGQVKPLKSGNLKSSGVGLTFCQLAIKSHGNEIGVDSEPGKGCCFWYTLEKVGKENIANNEEMLNAEEALPFSQSDTDYLSPFVDELKKHNIFELSQIRKVIRQIESDSPPVTLWKDKVSEALMGVNERRFNELLDQVNLHYHEE